MVFPCTRKLGPGAIEDGVGLEGVEQAERSGTSTMPSASARKKARRRAFPKRPSTLDLRLMRLIAMNVPRRSWAEVPGFRRKLVCGSREIGLLSVLLRCDMRGVMRPCQKRLSS